MKDIKDAVRESTTASGTNIPQLVGMEDGTLLFPTFDWASFFVDFKELKGIKSQYHFRCTKAMPGWVAYRPHSQ